MKLLINKCITILFFVTICASYGQTKLLDSLIPKSTTIKNVTQFRKAVGYFEEAIKTKGLSITFLKIIYN